MQIPVGYLTTNAFTPKTKHAQFKGESEKLRYASKFKLQGILSTDLNYLAS